MSEQTNLKTVKDVVFAYTDVVNPKKVFPGAGNTLPPPKSAHKYEHFKWYANILLPDANARKMMRVWKGAINFKNAKADLTPADLIKTYKISKEIADMHESWTAIRFGQNVLRGGDENRVMAQEIELVGVVQDAEGNQFDLHDNWITQKTPIPNGSKGHLRFVVAETAYGINLYPNRIYITELAEDIYSAPRDPNEPDDLIQKVDRVIALPKEVLANIKSLADVREAEEKSEAKAKADATAKAEADAIAKAEAAEFDELPF